MQATGWYNKISLINVSLNSINHRIARLNETIDYLKGFSATNTNGLSIVAVPAGNISKPVSLKRADNISMKCLITSPPGPLLGPSAVGTLVDYTDDVFNPLPLEALKALKTMMDYNNQIRDIVNSGIGKTSVAKIKKIAKLTQEISLLTAKYFIPVVSLDLGTKNYSSVSISYTLDRGEKVTQEIAWFWRKLLSVYIPDVPKIVTMVNLSGEIGLNGVVDGIIYTDAISNFGYLSPFPEYKFFEELNNSINEHMKEYQRLKSRLETERQAFQFQVDALVNNRFNCQ